MKTLILNSSNIVGSGNNTYRYAFPQGGVTFKNNKIGLTTLSIYYSWENIASTNNGLSYIWTDGTVVQVNPPAGFYTVQDLNAYLQSIMVANKHYRVNSAGDYVYYLQLVTNATYYAVQLNSFAVPNTLPSGWTNPGVWSLPGTAKTPQLTIGTLSSIIGIPAGTYPTPTQSTNYSKLSTTTPQVTPIQSLVMTCNLINNPYSVPTSLFYSFSPDGTYGSLLKVDPNNPVHIDIKDGQYTELIIKFLDQSFNPVTIKDPNTVILLEIE